MAVEFNFENEETRAVKIDFDGHFFSKIMAAEFNFEIEETRAVKIDFAGPFLSKIMAIKIKNHGH